MPRPRRGSTTPAQAAEALARVAPLVSRWLERLLASHDPPLGPAQYLALQAVAEGDVVGADLARRAAVSPAAVSQLLAGLEELGLIERARTEVDRRRQSLAPTPRGEEVLASVRALLRERLGQLLAKFPPPEADALARALGRVESLVAGSAPPPRPRRPPRPR